MSNRKRAADVIRTWQSRHKTEMDTNTDWAAQNLAGDLADEGLITPDLPEKTNRGDWKPTDTTTVTIEEDGTITVKEKISPIQTLIDWNATPEDTEKLAHALLAAVKDTRND